MPRTILRSTGRDDLREATSDGRFYWWKGEGPFISVTNALKHGVPKPALMYWSARTVAEYVANNWDEAAQLREQMDTAEFTALLKNKPWRDRDKKADLGSLVHDAAEEWALTGDTTISADLPEEAARKLAQFHNFMSAVQPELWATEVVVYNRQFGYAGALDLILELDVPNLDGHRFIVDIKTGSGVYAEAALQQTAYRNGEFMGIGDDEVDMPDVDGALILHLTQTGWKLVPVVTDQTSWYAFRAALHVAKWRIDKGPGTEKEAVGRPVAQSR